MRRCHEPCPCPSLPLRTGLAQLQQQLQLQQQQLQQQVIQSQAQPFGKLRQILWWKKSCTTLDGWNPFNDGINHLSAGAGFLPSTLSAPTCQCWNPFSAQWVLKHHTRLGGFWKLGHPQVTMVVSILSHGLLPGWFWGTPMGNLWGWFIGFNSHESGLSPLLSHCPGECDDATATATSASKCTPNA